VGFLPLLGVWLYWHHALPWLKEALALEASLLYIVDYLGVLICVLYTGFSLILLAAAVGR